MSRKIISDQTGQASLIGELKKEFSVYTAIAGAKFREWSAKYPRAIFAFMVSSILLSGILAFTVMRINEKPTLAPATLLKKNTGPGFGEIVGAGQALKEVLDLQNQINVVLHKDSLSATDTVQIKAALDRLEAIQRQVNHNRN